MLAAAMSRIHGRPDLEEVFGRAQIMTSQQQRYIARSHPVACQQAAAALRFFLAN